jgi:hypothetical protein
LQALNPMFQRQPVFSQLQQPARVALVQDQTDGDWSGRRKLLVILAGSLAAWLVWAGAAVLIWRALAS